MDVKVYGAEPVPQNEIDAYIERAEAQYGKQLTGIEIFVDGDEVELTYHVQHEPFERIRRITGYLIGSTERWNDAKLAEERDRLKHEI